MFFDEVKLKTVRSTSSLGAGIYTVAPDYKDIFVTDNGHFILISGRILTGEDLMQAFRWGMEFAEGPLPEQSVKDQDYGDPWDVDYEEEPRTR